MPNSRPRTLRFPPEVENSVEALCARPGEFSRTVVDLVKLGLALHHQDPTWVVAGHPLPLHSDLGLLLTILRAVRHLEARPQDLTVSPQTLRALASTCQSELVRLHGPHVGGELSAAISNAGLTRWSRK